MALALGVSTYDGALAGCASEMRGKVRASAVGGNSQGSIDRMSFTSSKSGGSSNNCAIYTRDACITTSTGAGTEVKVDLKFKILRQQLRGLETYHDTMYHSSIASRLASQ